ncbi:preprotein translocase subunit SecG [Lacisediminimonas sp.]|uniref:preprotein translocase subunit SecG n=1 Tax=Lacisediminimonas sp. TaxID=3060582 RepID=UPI0027183B32|nr:preprotein translocase subunit SecG [Lacisediminimonas sp.]MDO8299181.1 preprotein translocase subunit SecG [Lacisediminimonas sp.]MDO9218401.1 preprotein translocase subunit SecG [Lacisediminimonas sp.]
MNSINTVIVVVQVVSALAIIGLVLLQHGKGADMGAAFGSGASGSLFGATGSSNFLSKITGLAATIFFIATLGLAFLGNRPAAGTGGVMDKLPANSIPTPSVPVPGAPSAPAASAPAVNSPVPGSPAPAAPGQSGQIPK